MIRMSEFVSVGHPDKVADYISEYLLDRYLEEDPATRYAVEVQIKGFNVSLAGEVTSKAKFDKLDIEEFVKEAVNEIGYTKEYALKWGTDNTIFADALDVKVHISEQSPDIAQGVDNDGWGDQGIFFGMADPDGGRRLPEDYRIACDLGRDLYWGVRDGVLDCGLDIKVQVVYEDGRRRPAEPKLKKIIVAIPVRDEAEYGKLTEFIQTRKSTRQYRDKGVELIINGTGSFVKHGPIADCGTTGRKLAVDFYGGNCRIGGGSPWTKDGSKADLALNLFAREIALHQAHLHKERTEVHLGCCIGRKEVDYCVTGEGGKLLKEGTIEIGVEKLVQRYGLRRPIYAKLCQDGLFGDLTYPWEQLNMYGI